MCLPDINTWSITQVETLLPISNIPRSFPFRSIASFAITITMDMNFIIIILLLFLLLLLFCANNSQSIGQRFHVICPNSSYYVANCNHNMPVSTQNYFPSLVSRMLFNTSIVCSIWPQISSTVLPNQTFKSFYDTWVLLTVFILVPLTNLFA